MENARRVFLQHGGVLRTCEAIRFGIHPSVLYNMRDQGLLETLSRGLYRLADQPNLAHPDLVTVAKRAPGGVICLISALAYHAITTEIPHVVDLALTRGSESPRIVSPPIRVYWTVPHIHSLGIEQVNLDGHAVRIYSPERCLVDIFRYRNKLGLDTALEALRLYRERLPLKVDTLMNLAQKCRVAKTITPYLESTL